MCAPGLSPLLSPGQSLHFLSPVKTLTDPLLDKSGRKLCIKLIRSILLPPRTPRRCPSRSIKFSAEVHGKAEMPGKSIYKIKRRLNQVLHWLWLFREGDCEMVGCGSGTLDPLAGVLKAALIQCYYVSPGLLAVWSAELWGPGPRLLLKHSALPKAGYWLLEISRELTR